MKKLFLSLFLTGIMFATNAATVEQSTMVPLSNIQLQQALVKNPTQYELHFSCDGGQTWGTVCCFDSEEEALADWEAHADQYCEWAN